MRKHALTALALVAASGASAQTFSLDDNPSRVDLDVLRHRILGGRPVRSLSAGCCRDGSGLRPSLITVSGGVCRCRPAHGGPVDPGRADPRHGFARREVPRRGEPDHDIYHPEVSREMNIRFSVDRATRGLPGTPLASEFANDQHPGISTSPSASTGTPVSLWARSGQGLRGALPTAAPAGVASARSTSARADARSRPGTFIGPGLPAPMIAPGRHDNVDAFNILPDPMMDIDGDGKNDRDSYFSIPPTEALARVSRLRISLPSPRARARVSRLRGRRLRCWGSTCSACLPTPNSGNSATISTGSWSGILAN